MNAGDPLFLEFDEVVALHAQQLEVYGGGTGLRDAGLLESAVMQAQSSFGGVYVHDSLFEMAAAYLFHIVSNHPFVDGNKRTGLLAALVFLNTNGVTITRSSATLYDLTLGVAEGRLGKQHVATVLARLASEER